ncbi:basigin [Leguminivora glycinivorella]|uniref:basigin n=1 Tax=Leguminivora glycinivorella TaxID=1035111 RepID=UPI00200CD001|nr:basigin [Leguminivora glycinivorella]
MVETPPGPGPEEEGPVIEVVVPEGAPLELACVLRVEQRAEWRREGSAALPAALQVAGESAGAGAGAGSGGLTARLRAAAATRELQGVYSCARGPQAQRLRVVVKPRPAAYVTVAAAATEPATTLAPAGAPLLRQSEVLPVRAESGGAPPGTPQYYDVGRNTSMTCSIPAASGQQIVWEKNNTVLANVKEIKDRYKLESDNARLVISRSVEEDYGNYSCKAGGEAQHWQLRARVYTKLPSTDSSVVDGQKLKLVCKMIGKPALPVKWFYNKDHTSYDEEVVKDLQLGVELETGGRIKLENSDAGIENGQLVIEAAERADAGAYACIPDFSAAGNHTQSPHLPAVTVLRVKDMYAALWPFLGICAEVLVLCAIILVYEKRRTKPELDDSDTDNHDQKKS